MQLLSFPFEREPQRLVERHFYARMSIIASFFVSDRAPYPSSGTFDVNIDFPVCWAFVGI